MWDKACSLSNSKRTASCRGCQADVPVLCPISRRCSGIRDEMSVNGSLQLITLQLKEQAPVEVQNGEDQKEIYLCAMLVAIMQERDRSTKTRTFLIELRNQCEKLIHIFKTPMSTAKAVPAKPLLNHMFEDFDEEQEKVHSKQTPGYIVFRRSQRSQRSLCVDTSLDVYKAIMELNFLGTISLTKHILPHFLEMKKGLIVTINSVSGMAGVPLSSGYSASKHALQGFFNSLRTELADTPNIIISNVLPGPVQSDIVKNAFTEELGKRVPVMTDQSHKMSTQRCIHLILVAMANNLEEVWIADQPFLAVQYLWQYAPTWAWWITSKLGKRRVENFKRGLDADAAYFTKAK
ncbi:dehydrogenase/reductase SDR family member 7-like [Polypterus senegalus]|uniref:dehydrogenase/reductase SDR family member 7-like n=1 Tax=Polypterus senegalus TaxID=55291 RepID=UPI00196649DF|nr:dehydrogenase/reductase SDR family member 7-like [Polypterus senegalus]